MKRTLLMSLASTALMIGAAAAQTTYTLDVTVTEQTDGATRTSTLQKIIPIVDGAINTNSSSKADRLVVTGGLEVDQDGKKARAKLVVCEPEKAVCNPIAKPDLSFTIGEPVALQVGGERITIRVSLTPVSQ